jgi:phosphate transport system protein
MAAHVIEPCVSSSSEHAQIVALTLKGCDIAKSAVSHAADDLARRSNTRFAAVKECEKALDRLGREIAERVTSVVSQAGWEETRELLACLKFALDLERIGDLVCSLGGRAQAIDSSVDRQDLQDLIHMAAVLEQMLVDISEAFSRRDPDRALAVIRADAEIDRGRNLLFIRYVEDREGVAGQEGLQVLSMAQALERAGDHAKDLAAEICRLVSGHSARQL